MGPILLLSLVLAAPIDGALAKPSRTLFEQLIELKVRDGLLVVEGKPVGSQARTIIRSARYSFPGIQRFSYAVQGSSSSSYSGGSGGSLNVRFQTDGNNESYLFQLTSADNRESVTLRQESAGKLNFEYSGKKFSLTFRQQKGKVSLFLKAGKDSVSATESSFDDLLRRQPVAVRKYLIPTLEAYFAKTPVEQLFSAPPGKVLFELKDGGRIVGALELATFELHTDYGTLALPVAEVREIHFPGTQKTEGGNGEKESPEGESQEPAEDELDALFVIVTERFTPVGRLEVSTFEVSTPYGRIRIEPADIERIAFGAPTADD